MSSDGALDRLQQVALIITVCVYSLIGEGLGREPARHHQLIRPLGDTGGMWIFCVGWSCVWALPRPPSCSPRPDCLATLRVAAVGEEKMTSGIGPPHQILRGKRMSAFR